MKKGRQLKDLPIWGRIVLAFAITALCGLITALLLRSAGPVIRQGPAYLIILAVVVLFLLWTTFRPKREARSYSALVAAVRSNDKKAVKTLLGGGEDVNARSLSGMTALDAAVRNGSGEIVELLR